MLQQMLHDRIPKKGLFWTQRVVFLSYLGIIIQQGACIFYFVKVFYLLTSLNWAEHKIIKSVWFYARRAMQLYRANGSVVRFRLDPTL